MRSAMKQHLVFVVLCLIQTCRTSKILLVSPVASRSHFIMGSELGKALSEAGHDVTIVSPYRDGFQPNNKSGSYLEVQLGGFLEELMERRDGDNMFKELWKWNIPILMIKLFNDLGLDTTELTLKNKDMQKLMKSGQTFDVVLLEQFSDEALKCLAPYFKAHLIIYNTIGTTFWTNEMTGNPVLPSYHPDAFLHLSPKMNFWERLKNTVFTTILKLSLHLYYYPKHNALVQQYISKDLNLYDTLYNQSLVLINSHISVANSIPSVPQMVYIGGYHLKPPKPLPTELQEFLDGATHGAIFFSMGSVLRSKEMPVDKRDVFIKTFGKFQQKILWKWDDEQLPTQPRNVKIAKWLPQADILAHPNVRLFVTHCGYGSFTESIYHGKPMVTLPVFGDQKVNALNSVHLGIAANINFEDLTEQKLTDAIKEVLENSKYTKNVRYTSNLFKDRKVEAIDDAIYWIEYVIRHNGAEHLKATYLNMPWYQYYLIDVLSFLFLIIYLQLLLIQKLYRKLTLYHAKKPKKE